MGRPTSIRKRHPFQYPGYGQRATRADGTRALSVSALDVPLRAVPGSSGLTRLMTSTTIFRSSAAPSLSTSDTDRVERHRQDRHLGGPGWLGGGRCGGAPGRAPFPWSGLNALITMEWPARTPAVTGARPTLPAPMIAMPVTFRRARHTRGPHPKQVPSIGLGRGGDGREHLQVGACRRRDGRSRTRAELTDALRPLRERYGTHAGPSACPSSDAAGEPQRHVLMATQRESGRRHSGG